MASRDEIPPVEHPGFEYLGFIECDFEPGNLREQHVYKGSHPVIQGSLDELSQGLECRVLCKHLMPRICCYDVKEAPSQHSQEINLNFISMLRICFVLRILFIKLALDKYKAMLLNHQADMTTALPINKYVFHLFFPKYLLAHSKI